MGGMISIGAEDGRTFEAYLARPASPRGPGLVVLS
jgi:dienelactone hydrolase